MTLADLARRAGTSAPALHRYESGWDRFEVGTLRRIAAALDARLEIRLVARDRRVGSGAGSPGRLVRVLAPLFWDRDLQESDLEEHALWVLARVLTAGDRSQVESARAWFGDEAILRTLRRRDVDARTRGYWKLLLEGGGRASQGARA